MANGKSIREAADRLDESVLELTIFAAVALDLAGDDPQSEQWPFLISRFAARIEADAQLVGKLARGASC